ncbi:MAG TPA: hypothetical protein PLE45_09720 [Spirochaetota bacterium]|nr:hypothetical protein [Spirochaetota bacterium]HOL57337.1 hypothetical protein [Spirochaetota bacterium]HPP04906.1 hypothetical protein [Spirochaetota bacterium]
MPIDKNIEDLELTDLDTDTLAIDNMDNISDLEVDSNSSELDNIDLDISEIDTDINSFNLEEEENKNINDDTSFLNKEPEDNLTENLEDEKIKIDSDIDLNLDFESGGEEGNIGTSDYNDISEDNTLDNSKEEEIDLSLEESFKEIENDITGSNVESNLDDLDIKNDLGLEDELSLGTEEEIDSDFNLDITDDTGNIIDASEEEFGVDLKSGPVTIDFFDEQSNKEENLSEYSENLIDFDELDEKMSKDDTVLNLNIPEKKPLTLSEEQTKYLEEETEEEKIDIEDNFEEINKDLEEFKVEEDLNDLSLETLEDEAMRKSEALVTDEELANLDTEENIDLSLDNIETEEIEEATLAEEEISLEKSGEEEEKIEEEEKLEELDNIDYDVELNTLEIQNEKEKEIHFNELEKKEELNPEEEKIVLDETELSEVEEVIFPDDENMPELDEDIKSIGLKDSDLEGSISPLTDTDTVFSEKIQSEESELTLEEELNEEDASLSPTELDNIINTTELIETPAEEIANQEEEISLEEPIFEEAEEPKEENLEELDLNLELEEESGIDIKEEPQTIEEPITESLGESETIDLSNFEAELVDANQEEVQTLNISKEEEEDIYNSLRKEMQSKKKEESGDLKEEVKLVLSYLDQLLDSLPEEKIKEFAESKTFEIYRKLFEELNIKS